MAIMVKNGGNKLPHHLKLFTIMLVTWLQNDLDLKEKKQFRY